MTTQKPSKLLYIDGSSGPGTVNSIRGFSWPEENLYMDFPSGPCTFPKLSCRVHGFSLGPLHLPKTIMPSTWIFHRALGFSKNLCVRVHGFFFPATILYIDFIYINLNHLFSQMWPCKKSMCNFDFGEKMKYAWIFKFPCIKPRFLGWERFFGIFHLGQKSFPPQKPRFYTWKFENPCIFHFFTKIKIIHGFLCVCMSICFSFLPLSFQVIYF